MQYLAKYVTNRLVYQLNIGISHGLLQHPPCPPCSIGVSTSLQLSILISFNKSSMYFCCEMKIPFFEQATSIPENTLVYSSLLFQILRPTFS